MAYVPTTWVDENGTGNGTVLTAARLNNMESGIVAAAPAAPVTALPGSPTTGQRCLFQTAAMAALSPPIMWDLAYDGAKWMFMGGPPLFALVAAVENTTVATYVALTTAGPSIAVPVAGVYDVTLAVLTTGTVGAAFSYDIGATPAVDADDVVGGESATIYNNVLSVRRKTLTAVTLTAKYRTLSAGTPAYFQQRSMMLTPVRLG